MLKTIRKRYNITQKEISKELNISQSLLSKIENRKSFGISFCKYLVFLHKKGVNMNEVFQNEKIFQTEK